MATSRLSQPVERTSYPPFKQMGRETVSEGMHIGMFDNICGSLPKSYTETSTVKIKILYPESKTLAGPQAAAINKLNHQPINTFHAAKKSADLIRR